MSRLLLCCLLVLSLLAGAGVVAADGGSTDEGDCPAVTHEKGSQHASDTAVWKSGGGRLRALASSGCV